MGAAIGDNRARGVDYTMLLLVGEFAQRVVVAVLASFFSKKFGPRVYPRAMPQRERKMRLLHLSSFLRRFPDLSAISQLRALNFALHAAPAELRALEAFCVELANQRVCERLLHESHYTLADAPSATP